MKVLKTLFYEIWIFNHVLYQMIRDKDYFYGRNDFKDFITAWRYQVNQYWKTNKNPHP